MVEVVDRGRYLRYDPFAGDKDDAGVRAWTIKVVKTRTKQACQFGCNTHTMPVGTLAQYNKGIIDNEWRSFYVCCPCIDKWFKKWGE